MNGFSQSAVLDLGIEPDWEAVRSAWDSCRASLARAGLPDDESYQIAMVAQELLENAVKYGNFQPGERVKLEICIRPDETIVEVKNRVGVGDANLRRFDQ